MNVPSTLSLVFWELTARCNLRCVHCRASATETPDPGELTTDQILAVARDIRAVADPILVLTGGEPLVRPDFFRIADACVKIFSRVALATNGTLIDDATAQKIKATGIQRVSVSLDGADADTHDAFRGLPGSFHQALAGIGALRKNDISLQINVTVTRRNEHQLDDLLQLALDRGADAFHLFMLVPVGCGATLDDRHRLGSHRTEEILRWLFEQSLRLTDRLQIKATCAPQYFRVMHQAAREKSIPLPKPRHALHTLTRGCLAGSGVCFLSRTGDVQPCGYLPVRAGNVLERNFAAIWNAADVFVALRNPGRLLGKCGRCEFRTLCLGCRARAYAHSGNLLDPDPDCPHQP